MKNWRRFLKRVDDRRSGSRIVDSFKKIQWGLSIPPNTNDKNIFKVSVISAT